MQVSPVFVSLRGQTLPATHVDSALKDVTMKTLKALWFVGIIVAGTAVWAASPERYLHVKVNNPKTHELVRVNLPLSFAEKVIPAINHGQLRDGQMQIGHMHIDVLGVYMSDLHF